MLRKFIPLSVLFVLLASVIGVSIATQQDTQGESIEKISGPLKPSKEQNAAIREIVSRLRQHYRSMPLDDALSETVFNRYLRDLDPNRLHFLASDIKEFEEYRTSIDDQLRNGELQAGYDIFNRYQVRLERRFETMLSWLNEGVEDWTFESERMVELDRSEAPWPRNESEQRQLWKDQLKNAVLTMRLTGSSDEDIVTRLERRYSSQLERARQNTPEDVFQAYANALTQSYDPHTTYFTPHNSRNFDISMSRSLEGIGAVLQSEDGFTRIVRLVPGGPASKQGQLQPADRIVGVGQGKDTPDNVIGLRLDEVVDQIRGPAGTEVTLEIIPAGSANEHDTRFVTLERNKVVLEEQAARKEVIELDRDGDVSRLGVITIPAFYMDFAAYHRGDPNFTSTTTDVAKLIMDLRDENIDGLIIDLRNNGGGSLMEVNRLVSLFINKGPTVQVRQANGRVSVEGDQFPGVLYAGPMAVMVNRFSASASEIFAGAMQDYGRALVIGEQTYGKGTVQTLLDLNHGKLKITNAKFYRVSGSSNQSRGILPDIALPSLINKDDVGESSLPNAMAWDEIKPAKYQPVSDLVPFLPLLRQRHEARIEDSDAFSYVQNLRALLEENRNRTHVSLNESVRRNWQENYDQQRLSLENQRRAQRGEEPLKDIESLRTVEEQRRLDPSRDEDDTKDDPYVLETANILTDFAMLINQHRVARNGD